MRNVRMAIWVVVVIFALPGISFAEVLSWDWESGTSEDWYAPNGNNDPSFSLNIISIEQGKDSLYSLGAANISSKGFRPAVKISDLNQLDPRTLVDNQYGSNLPLTGEFYVDLDTPLHSFRLDVIMQGAFSYGRFEASGSRGEIVDLGDGWYRHYLANTAHILGQPDSSYTPGDMIMILNLTAGVYQSGDVIRVDNLYINGTGVPEPTTLLLLGLGAFVLRRKR